MCHAADRVGAFVEAVRSLALSIRRGVHSAVHLPWRGEALVPYECWLLIVLDGCSMGALESLDARERCVL